MKCAIFGTETKNKTKNIPLSREGREAVKQYINEVRNSGQPFIMTIRMAIDDLANGRSVLEKEEHGAE